MVYYAKHEAESNFHAQAYPQSYFCVQRYFQVLNIFRMITHLLGSRDPNWLRTLFKLPAGIDECIISYAFFGLRSPANYSALIDVLIVFRMPILLGPIIFFWLGVSEKPPDFSIPGRVLPPVEGGESGGFSLVLI